VPTPEDQQWFGELLERELRPWIKLSGDQTHQLYGHYRLLQLWNKKLNLTSVKPGSELVLRHYCESLFFGANFPGGPEGVRIADIGSGAGFPGVPLAILHPRWHVSLVESDRRKSVFLRESTRGLDNVSVIAERAEQIDAHFDWVVSRGVNPEQVLPNVPRLASHVGLMLSEADFSAIKSRFAIAWADPVRLPWGIRRICVYGKSSRGGE
jgi:16S rRNA (guanine527-N7)-methyltransferase